MKREFDLHDLESSDIMKLPIGLMKASKYTEEQIIAVLREAEAGARVVDPTGLMNLKHARDIIEDWRKDHNGAPALLAKPV